MGAKYVLTRIGIFSPSFMTTCIWLPLKIEKSAPGITLVRSTLMERSLKEVICTSSAVGVCLVKPQFEAGRDKVGKKGVVREPSTHAEVLHMAQGYAMANHFTPAGLDFSPIKGPEGNIEFLMYVQHCDHPQPLPQGLIEQTVTAAHTALDKAPNLH